MKTFEAEKQEFIRKWTPICHLDANQTVQFVAHDEYEKDLSALLEAYANQGDKNPICQYCGKYKTMRGDGMLHQLCECNMPNQGGEQSLPEPIRCKALRKKGTDDYYHTEYEVWWTFALPMLLSKEATEEEWNLMVENGNALPLPPDAELVSLEIYVKPNL